MKTCAQDSSALVLTVLAEAPQHGHGIIRDVQEISGGRVRLRPGTLYTALDRLQAEGLIETGHETAVEGGPRRYYRASAAVPQSRRAPVPATPSGPTPQFRPAPARMASAPVTPSRLAWLDALRGIAAMMVVLDHSSSAFLPGFREELMPRFDCGRYGVMVFFLVSGYVIPASLERRGSVRAFWIGRVFRMYPLWAAAVGAVLLLYLAGHARLHGELPDGSASAVAAAALAHATLLQELLGTDSVLLVLWTLSYEMVFYLLATALFAFRRHRGSAPVAIALAAMSVLAALAAATGATGAAASVLRPSALSAAVGTVPLTVVAAAALVAAVCCAGARSRAVRVPGAVLGAVLALVLVLFNGTVPTWESLVLLALMFLGTAVHRAERAQIPARSAALAAAVVIVCALVCAGALSDSGFNRRGWTVAFALAALTFAAGLTVRRRRLPCWLTGLGTISYSVYLLHPVLLSVVHASSERPERDSLLLELGFLAVLLPLSVLTYRCIEEPGQAWGRRLARRAG